MVLTPRALVSFLPDHWNSSNPTPHHLPPQQRIMHLRPHQYDDNVKDIDTTAVAKDESRFRRFSFGITTKVVALSGLAFLGLVSLYSTVEVQYNVQRYLNNAYTYATDNVDLSHLPPLSKVPSEKKIPYSTCSDSDNGSNNNSIPIPHVEELRDAHLCRSLGHQRKFFSVRDSVLSWIKTHKEQRHLLKSTGTGGVLFAFIVNKDYAFRHIFKSGGTTIQKQTHKGASGHVPQWKVGNRHLFATVRDPIDHFLSGWAECGKRYFDDMMNLSSSSDGYDERVQAWLKYVRAPSSSSRGLKRCIPHSLPQANFLYDKSFQWDEKLDLVGDLKEISGLLELIGFRYNASIASGNVARDNEIKTRHFPRKKSLLSNTTIQDICSYVALDYYLFDFDPPIPCRETLTANMADIMNITSK